MVGLWAGYWCEWRMAEWKGRCERMGGGSGRGSFGDEDWSDGVSRQGWC